MNADFRIAVIVTTYNRPDALAAVLEGYLAQTDAHFELLVADDGSTPDTAQLVQDYQVRAPFPIQHIWHEDQGFRAAAIRNRALEATQAEYIIFTDGDCVPLRHFVARHRLLSEAGYFLSGNRVLLSQTFTRQVLLEKIPLHTWNFNAWVNARLSNKINRLVPFVNLSNFSLLRKKDGRRWRGAKTCNLSAWRADLLRINGFNESYIGWGQEDSDLVVRLIRSGILNKSARFAAPVLHLWHKENDRSHLHENQQRLQTMLTSSQLE